MKKSERGTLITGIILLALAAVFIIALMLQFLNFTSGGGVEHNFSLYNLGNIIFSVYRFSSFLIPVYLFFAAILLFTPAWTLRKSIFLFFSIIPFFTIAGIEFLSQIIFAGDTPTVAIIRTSTFLLVSMLLCSIEYIIIGLIAEQLENTDTKEAFRKIRSKKIKIKKERPIKEKSEKKASRPNADKFENPSADPQFEQGVPTEAESFKLNEPLVPVNTAKYISLDDADADKETLVKTADSQVESSVRKYDAFFDLGHSSDFVELTPSSSDDEAVKTEYIEIKDLQNIDEVDFLENPFGSENDEDNDTDNFQEKIGIQSPLVPAVPKRQKNKPYSVPAEGLLTTYPDGEYWIIDNETRRSADALKETLNEFKIEAEVTGIRKGPVVTMFEILPAPGVKLSKIVALGDNIALRLAASSVRIVAPIPGKHAVGIEVPNKERAIVSFKELIDTDIPAFKKMAIPVILGKDIAGDAQVLDLAKTPHLLIAGSTGSGKSVCVNSLILSILYKRPPQDVRMILIDPKIVELKLYNDIPHLLTPVITEPKKAFQALQYGLCEMERRYALLDGMGVRDIGSYNRRIEERKIATEKLPYIVIIIDEFADLMATTGKEMESTVARLAAMSRAVGLHLVLATQRPSIDVITGLIKANIPTRIAFMVASKMDSRIIIDQVGAEKLLGKGDMLYAGAADPFPVRIQGTFVSDTEVENVVDYVKQYGAPDYIDDEIFVDDDDENFEQPLFSEGEDPLYDKALEIVMLAGKASASYIQRRLKIGYNRAARLVEDMEARGIVGPANGSKPREVIHVV